MSAQSPSLRAAAAFALAESRELQRLTDDVARLVATRLPVRVPPPSGADGANDPESAA